MILLGVSYLFAIARSNGTLEAVARKTIGLAGRLISLIPVIMVVAGALLAMAGPGTIPVLALMVMLSTALAKELGLDPLSFTAVSYTHLDVYKRQGISTEILKAIERLLLVITISWISVLVQVPLYL